MEGCRPVVSGLASFNHFLGIQSLGQMWLPGSSTRPKRVPNGTQDPLGHPSVNVRAKLDACATQLREHKNETELDGFLPPFQRPL